MPCTNCMVEYSRSRKEHGCSKCAFGFCAKCLNKKFVIPALSPKPVSVCDNCYNILCGKMASGSQSSLREKSRIDSANGGAKSANWWGDDKLPPPSMRAQYAAEKQRETSAASQKTTRIGVKSKNADDWNSIERRLANLVGDLPLRSTSESTGGNTAPVASSERNVSLAEIEERLAALKGVPVELIRHPRLRIYDPNEDEQEESGAFGEIGDEAQKLLVAAEARAKFEQRHHGANTNSIGNNGVVVKRQTSSRDTITNDGDVGAAYDNVALQMDETLLSAGESGAKLSADVANDSKRSSASISSESSEVKKIITSALNAPSTKDEKSDSDDVDVFRPNFADCIKRTLRDAEMAERFAMEFISKSKKKTKGQESVEMREEESGHSGRHTKKHEPQKQQCRRRKNSHNGGGLNSRDTTYNVADWTPDDEKSALAGNADKNTTNSVSGKMRSFFQRFRK